MTACGHAPAPETNPALVQTVLVDRLVPIVPDRALRTCKARPGRPDLTDSSAEAVLIVDLDERGVDCAAKLEATWRSIDEAVARAEAANGREPGD